MRAVVITRPGGPEALAVEERPRPVPASGEVLVRVHATALNRADLLQREGRYPPPPGAPADIPGLEYAGEVAELGADVSTLGVGDRVFGIVAGGAHAEYVAVDAGAVMSIPERLSYTEAAAVPEAFITAYDALVLQARLCANEQVLIHAVGSGVGLAAVQIAAAWGARALGTARAADKIERARGYGLDGGVLAGEDPGALAGALRALSGGRGFDVALDLLGGMYLDASIRAAASRGRIMLIGTIAGGSPILPLGMVLGKRLELRGTVLRSRSVEEKRDVTAAFSREVLPLLAGGRLRPAIDRVYDLSDVQTAHRSMDANSTFGKIVLRVV